MAFLLKMLKLVALRSITANLKPIFLDIGSPKKGWDEISTMKRPDYYLALSFQVVEWFTRKYKVGIVITNWPDKAFDFSHFSVIL